MVVKLKRRSSRYPDLTAGHRYVVIGIEADDLRLLNDLGRPFLYPAKLFKIVDPKHPDDWVEERGNDGEQYAYPPTLNKAGFFRDYFDAKSSAVRTFWQVMNQRLAATMA